MKFSSARTFIKRFMRVNLTMRYTWMATQSWLISCKFIALLRFMGTIREWCDFTLRRLWIVITRHDVTFQRPQFSIIPNQISFLPQWQWKSFSNVEKSFAPQKKCGLMRNECNLIISICLSERLAPTKREKRTEIISPLITLTKC